MEALLQEPSASRSPPSEEPCRACGASRGSADPPRPLARGPSPSRVPARLLCSPSAPAHATGVAMAPADAARTKRRAAGERGGSGSGRAGPGRAAAAAEPLPPGAPVFPAVTALGAQKQPSAVFVLPVRERDR